MAKHTEKRASWFAYAAARSTQLFGRGKVISALVAVLFGMASPLASSDDTGLEWVAPTIFVGVTLLQASTTFLLFGLDRQRYRGALSLYYAIALFFCLAVTVGAAFRPIIGPFLGAMMSLGLAAIAFTAFYLLTNWVDLQQSRPDAAVFLGSTHVLALVAVAAATVRALFPTSGAWVDALAQTTFLSLTALALPLAAGLWVRLSVQARAVRETETDALEDGEAPGGRVAIPVRAIAPEEPTQLPELQNLRQDSFAAVTVPATSTVTAAVVVAVTVIMTSVLAVAARRRR